MAASNFADQLLRDWPEADIVGDDRFRAMRKFVREMTGKGFSREAILDCTEHADTVLCSPPIGTQGVYLAAGVTALTDEHIQKLMPKAEPQEKIVYIKAPSISEPTKNDKPPAKVELCAPRDIDTAALFKTDYLVKHLLDRAALAQLFGQWNTGKTFMALHLAAHIAAGQPWCGHRVHQGGVMYIGYEGERSMVKRVEALKREYPAWDWNAIPFRWYGFRWPLVNPTSAKCKGREMLDEVLGQFWFETGSHPALIIVDPLRDALGGSDSDPNYTAAYITLMRQIRDTIGATVLTLHHPGHGDKTRGRGDSGVDAAMDTVICMSKEKGRGARGQISATKQRDDARGAMYYQLKVVELGQDDEGDAVKTCVFEQTDATPEPLTGDQRKAWEAIGDNLPGSTMTEAAAREACKAAGIRSNHVTRALTGIEGRKLIKWDHEMQLIEFSDLFPFEDEDGE